MNASRKLKILCIHGYRQNGQSFREKTGSFRKCFRKLCDFDFISAPNVIDEDDSRGWWFSKPDNHFDAKQVSDFDGGFSQSLKVYQQSLLTQGPYDGILAFSQGAAFVLAAQLLLESGLLKYDGPRPRFAILVAPFRSRSVVHQPYYEHRISLPILVVYGHTDEVIPAEMTEDTLNLFMEPPTLLTHDRGHYIPMESTAKDTYKEFLMKFMSEND